MTLRVGKMKWNSFNKDELLGVQISDSRFGGIFISHTTEYIPSKRGKIQGTYLVYPSLISYINIFLETK